MDVTQYTAKQAASFRKSFGKLTLWVFTQSDNPHKRGTKEHVQWHNDFYDACREIGRNTNLVRGRL